MRHDWFERNTETLVFVDLKTPDVGIELEKLWRIQMLRIA